MLGENEARSTFVQLRGLLRELDLNWVGDQVQEQIAQGKTETADIRPFRHDVRIEVHPAEVPDVPRDRSDKFTRTVQYTETEKLHLLVDAVRRVTVDPLEMQSETVRSLKHQEYSFVSEDGSQRHDSSTDLRTVLGSETANLALLLEEIATQLDVAAF